MATLKLFQITIFLAILFSSSIKADDNPPNLENKCGDCPCDNPCNPPPSPPQPPPSPPPPPPAPKNPPPSNICPPPPSPPSDDKPPSPPSDDNPPSPPSDDNPPKGPNPPYIYINGPPGSVYPISPYNSGGHRSFLAGKFTFLIGCILWAVAF